MENNLIVLNEKRSDILHLDPRVINIVEGFNVREDYGDIEELASSIEENGVRVPLRGYKKDGEYFLIGGHRRHRASMLLISRGIELRVPFISEKNPSLESQLIDTYVCNDGKRLTPLEESALFNRLRKCGLSVKEISSKLRCTETHVYNMLILADVPTSLKNRIKNNDISATLVMSVVKENKDMDAEGLAKNIEDVLTSNGGKKVTRKALDKAANKVNSFNELRSIMPGISASMVTNKELYAFCLGLTKNTLDANDISKLLGVEMATEVK